MHDEITRLIILVKSMAERMGIEASRDPELGELSQDVRPEKVLDKIEDKQQAFQEKHSNP